MQQNTVKWSAVQIKKMKTYTENVLLRLTPIEKQKLDELAKSKHMTNSEFIRKYINSAYYDFARSKWKKKYALSKGLIYIDYKKVKQLAPGSFYGDDDYYEEEVERFDDLDKALETLKKYKTKVNVMHTSGNNIEIREYFIEMIYVNEEDEFMEGVDIIEFSKLSVFVTQQYEEIAEFNNYKDAQEFIDSVSDDESEDYHITF